MNLETSMTYARGSNMNIKEASHGGHVASTHIQARVWNPYYVNKQKIVSSYITSIWSQNVASMYTHTHTHTNCILMQIIKCYFNTISKCGKSVTKFLEYPNTFQLPAHGHSQSQLKLCVHCSDWTHCWRSGTVLSPSPHTHVSGLVQERSLHHRSTRWWVWDIQHQRSHFQ